MRLSSRLPAAPLQRALARARLSHGVCWEDLAIRLGVSSRTIARVMRAKILSPYVADHMAIRLGTHPALIWPNEWGRAAIRKIGGDAVERSAQAHEANAVSNRPGKDKRGRRSA